MQLFFVLVLTFVINLITTLSYSVRIVGMVIARIIGTLVAQIIFLPSARLIAGFSAVL